MNYKEAAQRIKQHNAVHSKKEFPNAFYITEALNIAVEVLEKADKLCCCKDCAFSISENCGDGTVFCKHHEQYFLETDFCNYADKLSNYNKAIKK